MLIDNLPTAEPEEVLRLVTGRQHTKLLAEILDFLTSLNEVSFIVWGGSMTERRASRKWSDVDLWLLCETKEPEFRARVRDRVIRIEETIVSAEKWLPWFGYLTTIYALPDIEFSIDIGIEQCGSGKSLYAGDAPHLIYKSGESPGNFPFGSRPEKPADSDLQISLLSNLIKLRKSLSRGYRLNAIEYLSRARRAVILLTQNPDLNYNRSDKFVEDLVSAKTLKDLYSSHPTAVSETSIATAATHLLEYWIKCAGSPDGSGTDNALRRILLSLEPFR